MPLEVIGAGFGRTGTNSLRLALEELGFGPCHHMFEVQANPELLVPWQAMARGEAPDFEAAFRGYRAQVDWPGARYWKELSEAYPDARVVLSWRDPDLWYESVERTIMQFMHAKGQLPSPHLEAIRDMADTLLIQHHFPQGIENRTHAIAAYTAHVEDVKATIAPDRLLVHAPEDGWAPLCAHLGVAVPGTPYPNTNSSREFHENVASEGRDSKAP